MVLFDVLIRRKPSLDQLRTGLETLNVLKQMEADPEFMNKFFLSQSQCDKKALMQKITFQKGSSEKSINAFEGVLKSFNTEQVSKFLVFVSGLNSVHMSGSISVKFLDCSAIFASTCTLELNIPKEICDDSDVLKAGLLAVIDSSWNKSFNTY